MNAFDRLVREAEKAGVDFGLWKDSSRVVPSNRYEVRVFGADDVRFIERAAGPYEALARAADRLASQ